VATATLTKPAELTRQEKWLRAFLWFIAIESLVFVGIYTAGGLFDGEEFRFVTNSAVKDLLFATVAAIAATDVRRFGWLTWIVIGGHVALIVVNGLLLIFTDQADVRMLGAEIPATTLMVVWMAVDAVIVAAGYLLYRAAQRARYELTYLGPAEFSTLRALAEVLIKGDKEAVPHDEIAQNVDRYLTGLDAKGKSRIKLAYIGLTLYPLRWGRLPFAVMSADARERFVKKRFIKALSRERPWILRVWPLSKISQFARDLVRAMIRAAQQFTFLGYYGDCRSYDSVGYKPFSARGRPAHPPARREVTTTDPAKVRSADVVVIGSGAAGAIVAQGLAKRGRDVLVLERGPHIPSRKISEDEVAMYLALYNEGALQLAQNFRFTVLQGMCVGGSTVINNAVCFRAPDRVLHEWNDRWQADLDLGRLEASYKSVSGRLGVQKMDEDWATPGAEVFLRGIDNLGLPGKTDRVDVNIADCVHCGYCNIGCQFDFKHSTLVSVLPDAQELKKKDPDAGEVKVISDCRVDAIDTSDGHARGVVCDVSGTRHRITAKTIVVSAGALNSSVLLLNSGIKRSLAGRRLHFNIVTPVTAEYPEEINSYDGLQISHYYEPPATGGARYMLETWFNPPATHSLVMPGWFEDHFKNMENYNRMVAGGVLVGTTEGGTVKANGSEPKIDYEPGQKDLNQLVDGAKQLCQIMIEGGAKPAMPQTYELHKICDAGDLAQLDKYKQDDDGLGINSAHPQGGNPMGRDWRTSVVDPDFRVHGMDNVYVCDASVFPTSVTVNPQLTVMALADYAAERIV
jgi:choline dehydrogenase-like flavoprotein